MFLLWGISPPYSLLAFSLGGRLGRAAQCGRLCKGGRNLPPHPPQCAHWGTFPQGEGIWAVRNIPGRAGDGTRPYGMCRSILSFRRGRTLAGPREGLLPFRPPPSSASHTLGTFPLGGGRLGRLIAAPTANTEAVPHFVGAGPRPARRSRTSCRLLGQARRGCGIAPASIFANPGPSGPAGI